MYSHNQQEIYSINLLSSEINTFWDPISYLYCPFTVCQSLGNKFHFQYYSTYILLSFPVLFHLQIAIISSIIPPTYWYHFQYYSTSNWFLSFPVLFKLLIAIISSIIPATDCYHFQYYSTYRWLSFPVLFHLQIAIISSIIPPTDCYHFQYYSTYRLLSFPVLFHLQIAIISSIIPPTDCYHFRLLTNSCKVPGVTSRLIYKVKCSPMTQYFH